MRGEVLHYDETQGFGFITGVDGNRYAFAREDLKRAAPMGKGTQVEFQPNAGYARGIFPVRAQFDGAYAEPGAAPPLPLSRPASGIDGQSTSLWSYFRRGITANYVNFRGRARRKEYWGFTLFVILGGCVLGAVCGVANVITGNDVPNEMSMLTLVVVGGFSLAMVLPNIALNVRRVHDVGLSGWFVLPFLIPYIGWVIMLVFTLIPSQKHENKWGPVPAGVKIPAPYAPAA